MPGTARRLSQARPSIQVALRRRALTGLGSGPVNRPSDFAGRRTGAPTHDAPVTLVPGLSNGKDLH
jgi:hypothetical protein